MFLQNIQRNSLIKNNILRRLFFIPIFKKKEEIKMKRYNSIEQILNMYYSDNAKKLHEIVDKILLKFGGLSDKDMDDFYSLANEVFVDVIKRYDNSQSFDGFLYSCLCNKIKTEMTKRNREKRRADIMSVSIDMPVSDDENTTLGDIIADNFNIEKVIFGEENNKFSKIEKYLERLSKRQRKVVGLLADSYGANEIQQILHITSKEYSDAMMGIHSYENIAVLF